MAIRFVRPVSHSAFWARRLGLVAFLMFAAAFFACRFAGLSIPDFAALSLASTGLAAFAMLLACIGLAQLWQVGALGGKAAFAGLIFASVSLVVVGFAAYAYFATPPVHELSTDPVDPPPFLKPVVVDQQWLPRQVSPEAARAGATAYTDFVGRRFDGAPDRVAAAVRKAARAVRLSIVATEGEELAEAAPVPIPTPAPLPSQRNERRMVIPIPPPRPEPLLLSAPPVLVGKPGDVLMQGVTRTLVFGVPFDVVIRLREENDNTLVDVRTVARFGDRDFGMGAAFIRAFFEALETEMLGLG